MLEKSLKKMLITTICVFVFFVTGTLTNIKSNEITKVSANITEPIYQTVYLLDQNNRLVRYKTEIEKNDINTRINGIISALQIDSNKKIPDFFKKIIPNSVKINNINVDNKILLLDLSKEIFESDAIYEEKILESLVYSITSIPEIDAMSLYVENTLVTSLPKSKITIPEVLTKDFGINKDLDISNFFNISKVTTYYYETINGNNYYVPVTKYINDDKDKIKIIIENLSSSYISEPNLSSYLSEATKLIDYKLDNDVMVLNFNEAIFDSNQKVLEEVIYSIASSVFANYDAKSVVFKVNGYDLTTKLKKDIE